MMAGPNVPGIAIIKPARTMANPGISQDSKIKPYPRAAIGAPIITRNIDHSHCSVRITPPNALNAGAKTVQQVLHPSAATGYRPQ